STVRRRLCLPFFQFLINLMDRQTHYVIKGTYHFVYRHIADPFLYAIGPSFVKRLEHFDVVEKLFLIQRLEMDFCTVIKDHCFVEVHQTDAGDYTMCISREFLKHLECLL